MKVLESVLFLFSVMGKNEVEVYEMLKLRLQGTPNEIRWFIRLLQREPRVNLENISTYFSNKGTERYKRLYTQVNRVDAKSKSVRKKSEDSEKDTYCGSGRTFCYCLGINADTRKHVDTIYDFETGLVKLECIFEGWQTSGSVRVVRMAFFIAEKGRKKYKFF